MNRPTVCVTGHRPDKLFGYNMNNLKNKELKNLFKKFLKEINCKEAITGMALGTDTLFALAVLELKDEGFDIKLHCAIPCKNHSCKWLDESVILYNEILSKADIVYNVSQEEYKPYLMQKRNEYMVDKADIVLSVWDGSSGGTKNCVVYASKKGKEIYSINPKDEKLEIKKR